MVGHVCRHDTLPKILLLGTVGGISRRRKTSKSMEIQHQGQSMSSLLRITDDRARWTVITADASVRVPQRRLGVTGIS